MSHNDTARALAIVEKHLRGVRVQMPRPDREKLADEILGELQSFFLMAPWPADAGGVATGMEAKS